jgi:predicted PurR-regulated permease PerM
METMERNPWLQVVLVLLALAGALWLFDWLLGLAGYLADIILLFFLAWLLAFVLFPLADRVATLRIPWVNGWRPLSHGPAVVLVYLGLLLVLVILGLLLAPVVVTQLAQLGSDLPGYAGRLPTLAQMQSELNRWGVPVDLNTVYQPQALIDQAKSVGGMLAQNALSIATGIVTVAFDLLVVLVLSFYLMLDGPALARRAMSLVPSRYQGQAEFFSDSVARSFGGFIRGQLAQAILYGLVTATVMRLAGLSFVAAVSTVCGLAMIIPFVGPVLAVIPPVALAAVQAPGAFVGVLLTLFLVQQVIVNVIAPKIMSSSIGMHPLMVLLSTMIGVRVAGFWGAFFGVPVTGVLYAMLAFFYRNAARDAIAGGRGLDPAATAPLPSGRRRGGRELSEPASAPPPSGKAG